MTCVHQKVSTVIFIEKFSIIAKHRGYWSELCMTKTKPCASPASKPNKESVVSKRNVNSLMDGEFYVSQVRPWNNAPSCVAHDGQSMEVVFAPGAG